MNSLSLKLKPPNSDTDYEELSINRWTSNTITDTTSDKQPVVKILNNLDRAIQPSSTDRHSDKCQFININFKISYRINKSTRSIPYIGSNDILRVNLLINEQSTAPEYLEIYDQDSQPALRFMRWDHIDRYQILATATTNIKIGDSNFSVASDEIDVDTRFTTRYMDNIILKNGLYLTVTGDLPIPVDYSYRYTLSFVDL